MKLEFLTSINDYDFSSKERVFSHVIKHNYNCDLFIESLKVHPKRLKNIKPLDTLAMWKLTATPAKPQDILSN